MMRIIHRYLGFFMAGILAVYAISGMTLIFRDTDFLKKERHYEVTIEPNLPNDQLSQALDIRRLRITEKKDGIVYFPAGTYNSRTGEAQFVKVELPYILSKLTHLHKAKTGDPLFFLNLFFGVSLLFLVISSFWMFRPKTAVFKKGLWFTLGGIILTLILLFV